MNSTNDTTTGGHERIALVTGASSGLGRATATLLAAQGFRVFGTSRDPAARAGEASFPMLALDVCDDESVTACVAEVQRAAGRIDALVSCAGSVLVGGVEETAPAEAQALMETNYLGVLRMMRAVLPSMRERGSGRIVNVSSLAGVVPAPFLGAYAASKHALEALSEAAAFEVRPFGVHVSLIELDAMLTALAFAAPAAPLQPYSLPRSRMLARLERATRETGEDPILLARCVLEALTSERPRLRYVVGEQSARVIEARRRLDEADFARLVVEPIGLWATPGAAGLEGGSP